MEGNTHMEYVNLGRSGLKVSRLSYGNFVNCKGDTQKLANDSIKVAWDAGINFFDTAELYGLGEGERQLGIAMRALNVPRSDYVITTKIFVGRFAENNNNHNNKGCSRKRLYEGLDRSLKNLEFEYVDVLFCHRYDDETPTEEVCMAMRDIINSGKALYWATSEWPPIRIMEAIHICDKIGCPRPIVEQCQYNMFYREYLEKDLAVLADDYGYGTTIWSPLASGILTGKYNNGIPEGSRFSHNSRTKARHYDTLMGEDNKDSTIKKLNQLADLAKELGCTLTQLAIAWTLTTKDVTTVLLGASSVEQLKENLAAAEFVKKITPEKLTQIEEILGNMPNQGPILRTGCPKVDRRTYK